MRCVAHLSLPISCQNTENACPERLKAIINNIKSKLNPETFYFAVHNDRRNMVFVFDMKDNSVIAMITNGAAHLGATLDIFPVMSEAELIKGAEAAKADLK